jgi:hypothetical protein
VKYNYNIPITCNDSDERNGNGGLDYFTKGQTNFSNGLSSQDNCSTDGITLEEAICDPAKQFEGTMSQSYVCPNGCSDGACIGTPAASCTDLTVTPENVINGGAVNYVCT